MIRISSCKKKIDTYSQIHPSLDEISKQVSFFENCTVEKDRCSESSTFSPAFQKILQQSCQIFLEYV
jgi:hypothetical protein